MGLRMRSTRIVVISQTASLLRSFRCSLRFVRPGLEPSLASILQTQQKTQNALREIAYELLSTERTYVAILTLLDQVRFPILEYLGSHFYVNRIIQRTSIDESRCLVMRGDDLQSSSNFP